MKQRRWPKKDTWEPGKNDYEIIDTARQRVSNQRWRATCRSQNIKWWDIIAKTSKHCIGMDGQSEGTQEGTVF